MAKIQGPQDLNFSSPSTHSGMAETRGAVRINARSSRSEPLRPSWASLVPAAAPQQVGHEPTDGGRYPRISSRSHYSRFNTAASGVLI